MAQCPGGIVGTIGRKAEFAAAAQDARDLDNAHGLNESAFPVAPLRPGIGINQVYARKRIFRQPSNQLARIAVMQSGRLVELLYDAIPAPARRTGGHPAKRTFQALRMEVNDELAVLRRAVPASLSAIGVGGRVVVESYHSLEDRIVKRAFTAVTTSEVPVDLPFVPEGSEPALRLVTRGAEKADENETEQNPRAASVRPRASRQYASSRITRRRSAASDPESRRASGSPRSSSRGA